MMSIYKRIVRKDSLEKLFNILKQNNKTVFAPVSRNEKISFRSCENYSSVATDYIQTTQSSKETAFPRTEKILDFTKNKDGAIVKPFGNNVIPEVILWGVRPCDAMGIAELSAIFNWDSKDEIYNSRLAKTTVLGFSCFKADEM